MSLSNALYTGVSGLNAYSNAISVIGNNIANVNTTGFKESRGNFEISQIPVDSFTETSGGGTMVSQASNRYDSSPATTSQRSPDEVYQTPRFSAPDPD